MKQGTPWTLDELRLVVERTDVRLDNEYSRFLLNGALERIEQLKEALNQLAWRHDNGRWFGNAYEDIDITDIVGRLLENTDAEKDP